MPPNFVADSLAGLVSDHARPEARILPGLLVTSVFGLLGYLSRGVTRSGAIAGTSVALLIYIGLGPAGFVTLFGVFAITWLTTRIGYRRKRQLGLAEDRRGRNAGQVFANLAVAAGFAVLALHERYFAAAAIAAMAEATADTASSEIGEALSGRAWLITNFQTVEPGTNGALSLLGTIAGISSALFISGLAIALHVVPGFFFWPIAAAGYLGTVVDSLLGATLERRHWLNNNAVNLLSTLAAGLLSLAFLR